MCLGDCGGATVSHAKPYNQQSSNRGAKNYSRHNNMDVSTAINATGNPFGTPKIGKVHFGARKNKSY